MTSTRLTLRPAPDVKPPKPPPIPKAALAEVAATKALWRERAADGRVVALVEHQVAKGMRLLRDDVSLLVATAKGALVASFPLGKDETSYGFRDVVHADASGTRFLYAYGRAVHELDLRGDAPTLTCRYTIRAGHFAPYEAIHLGDGAIASSEDRLYVLGPDWKQRATVRAGDVGYFHLARVGELLVASCYDVSTTAGGPTFAPDIVAYRLAGDTLEEVARGPGPGRDPVVIDGRLYVKHRRALHEVVGLP